jgi:hypothetical protein
MAGSTGPVVAAGAITYVNQVVGNGRPWNSVLIVAVGTAVAAGMLALLEHASAPLATGIAWIALVTSLLITPKNGQSAVTNALRLTGLGAKT